jgi:hypothetical protein
MRKGALQVSARTVGWNWTNSRSATAAPARSAIARPSAVAAGGFEVVAQSRPAPPAAIATTGADNRGRPPVDHGKEACAALSLDDEVDRERPLVDGDVGERPDLRDERPLDLGAGRVAPRVEDAAATVGRLPPEVDAALVVAVELGADLDQPVDGRAGALDELADGLGVAETGSSDQRVLLVKVRRVVRPDRGGDAALGPAGVALAEPALGQQGDPPTRRQRQRERQPGYPGPRRPRRRSRSSRGRSGGGRGAGR